VHGIASSSNNMTAISTLGDKRGETELWDAVVRGLFMGLLLFVRRGCAMRFRFFGAIKDES